MTLYEIDEKMLACVDAETGEVLNAEMLKDMQMKREQKIEGVALWTKNIRSDIDELSAEIKRLQTKKTARENLLTNLKGYLFDALEGEKFKSAKVSVYYKASDSVIVDDLTAIPDGYCRITREANKTDIKEALKQGEVIHGVHMETNNSIVIK